MGTKQNYFNQGVLHYLKSLMMFEINFSKIQGKFQTKCQSRIKPGACLHREIALSGFQLATH